MGGGSRGYCVFVLGRVQLIYCRPTKMQPFGQYSIFFVCIFVEGRKPYLKDVNGNTRVYFTLNFALHGGFSTIFCFVEILNQSESLVQEWLLKLPWEAQMRLPCESARKTVSENGVKTEPAF